MRSVGPSPDCMGQTPNEPQLGLTATLPRDPRRQAGTGFLLTLCGAPVPVSWRRVLHTSGALGFVAAKGSPLTALLWLQGRRGGQRRRTRAGGILHSWVPQDGGNWRDDSWQDTPQRTEAHPHLSGKDVVLLARSLGLRDRL